MLRPFCYPFLYVVWGELFVLMGGEQWRTSWGGGYMPPLHGNVSLPSFDIWEITYFFIPPMFRANCFLNAVGVYMVYCNNINTIVIS